MRASRIMSLVLLLCFFSSVCFAANSKPTVKSISPDSGFSNSDLANTFTVTYTDADGWQNIQWVMLLFNNQLKEGSACEVGYNQNTNQLYLKADDGVKWLGGYAPGAKNIIENSQAKLDCALTTISGKSNTLTVKFKITFKTAFIGIKNTYLFVQDASNDSSGWVQKGDFLVMQAFRIKGHLSS